MLSAFLPDSTRGTIRVQHYSTGRIALDDAFFHLVVQSEEGNEYSYGTQEAKVYIKRLNPPKPKKIRSPF